MREILLVMTALILTACVTPSSSQSAEVVRSSSSKSTETIRLPDSKIELSIEFRDAELQTHKIKIASLIDDAFVHYTELFGGVPKKLNGEPYDRLTVSIYDGFGGEADPEWIELGINDTRLYGGIYGWEVGILHEVLHLWSAETFRYIDGQEHWFNEGVTEYYTFRAAAKMGLIPEDQVISVFTRPVATYLSATDIGKLSPREAGSTDKLKQTHYFLVYHGGYVAGLMLDHQIRLKSQGTHTLDDLMRELYQSNSRTNLYSMETLIESTAQSTSVDISDFLHKYIDGNEIIPIGSYFDLGKLELMTKLGIDITNEEQKVLQRMFTFQ